MYRMSTTWATFVFMGVPTLMYLCQAVFVHWQQGKYGMAVALFSYAQANVGLMMNDAGI